MLPVGCKGQKKALALLLGPRCVARKNSTHNMRNTAPMTYINNRVALIVIKGKSFILRAAHNHAADPMLSSATLVPGLSFR